MAVIILEGPDGTFKTTIAKELADKLGFQYIHGSSFESALLSQEDLFNWYKEMFDTTKDLVLDRSMYSNRVYAQTYPKYTLLSLDQVKELEDRIRLNHKDVMVIFCSGEIDDLFERVNSRGDDHIKTREEIEQLVYKYKEIYENEVSFTRGIYNSSKEDSAFFVEVFLGYIIHQEIMEGEDLDGHFATAGLC